MEGIKTNIDRLFDQFASDSLAYNVPRRLSSTFNTSAASVVANSSSTSTPNQQHQQQQQQQHLSAAKLAKKRKLSDHEQLHNNHSASLHNSTGNETATTAGGRSALSLPDVSAIATSEAGHRSQGSLLNVSTASQASVQFEMRRLRADVLDCTTKNTQLKNELENRAAVHVRMEYMYKTKVHSLEKQLKSSEAKLHDSDKHLKLLRRRDAASQAEASRAKHQIAELRCSHDTAIGQLQRAKQEVEEQLRDMHNELGAQLVQQRQRYDELEKNHAYRRDEVAALEERCAHLQERARRLTAFETAGELQKVQLENAQRRVVDLETELAELGEWREMSKTFQTRVARIPELEKEVERLRRENKNIYDTIGNKLLLEEEVHDLRSRLALSERTNADVVALQTSAQLLQAELNDYKAVAQDHCATGASGSATQLRARIEDILRNDVLLNSEKGAVRNEKNAAAEQVAVLQKQLEIYTKANDNLQTSLKFHKKTMHRVQKKLSLVANERDCYKQLIDNYEKDLTISGAISEMNPDSQLRAKLDTVEKCLDEYKELVSSLEKELHEAKNLPDIGVDSVASGEHYERFKVDIARLRQENETLQRRKAELELMLEQNSLKGGYNTDRLKVVHMSMNPTAVAQEAHVVELEKLMAEIERLKRRNRKLEQDHEELTVRMNETANMTCDLKEIGALREQIKSLDAKNRHQKELYKQASQEFREVCYMLFGYRVDRIGANNYRISSMYAEDENEYLNFRFEAGGLDMLSSEYSLRLAEMVHLYLAERGSLPAFLCTLNLELFNRTTMAMA